MSLRYINQLTKVSILLLFLLIPFACANRSGGGPQGGLVDETPPVMVKSSHALGALNVKEREFVFWFDENIQLNKPQEKVIVNPPQKKMPEVKSFGKKAVVRLKDDLFPNTTYVIDFTDAIEDYNEKNPLENFSFSFSTGDVLDTLEISGVVLFADNLEPDQGIFVGLHSNLNDTAFTNLSFEKVSRTDSRGRFTIKGVSPGRYSVFALADNNRDFKYSSSDERLAFYDSIIVPSTTRAFRQDTIFKDSITVDTILSREVTRFLPDDIVLRSFTSDFKEKYLKEFRRDVREKLQLYFSAPTEFPEKLQLLDFHLDSTEWFYSEKSINNDSITLWLRDSLLYSHDTLNVTLSYLKTDSLKQHVLIDDTISFIYRGKQSQERTNQAKPVNNKADKEVKDSVPVKPLSFLNTALNVRSVIDVNHFIQIEFSEPVLLFDSSFVKMVKVENDTVEVPVTFVVSKDSLSPRKYTIEHKWSPGTSYKLNIDSSSVVGVYGLHNNKIENKFSVKKLEEYGNLAVIPTGLSSPELAVVQLLTDKDIPLREARIVGDAALFMNINPGKYYVRLFIDSNEDGKWTTGDYKTKRNAELVYYLNKSLEIKPNWDVEEEWSVTSVEPTNQKLLEITKNKPEKKKEKKNQQQESQRASQGGVGAPRLRR